MAFSLNRTLDSLVGRVERSTALDPVADPLAGLAERLLSAGPLTRLLSGTSAGHPAHPAVVAVPMGSWLAASYLDLTGGPQSRRSARRLVGLGVVSAVPAALTGASDWSFTTGAERRVGLVHAAGNYLALALYAGSWFARRAGERGGHIGRGGHAGRGTQAAGTGLALAGLATVTATGWLGGHLSYARGVGVDTTAFQVLPDEWFDVIALDELQPDRPVLVHAAGVPVLLVLSDGELRAIADRCSHRGGPLHEGEFADGCITCPWHGGRFRVADGQVLNGPPTRSQRVLQTRTRYGSVQVRVVDEPGSLRTNPVS